MKKVINLEFKNIGKMFSKDKIQKMRQEDLRTFLVNNKKFMTKKEEDNFMEKLIGTGAESYPSGNEFFVERKGGSLRFINFDE